MNTGWNFARKPFRDDRPTFVVAGLLLLVGLALLIANLRLFASYSREVADVRAEIAALDARQSRADERAQAARTALASYRLSALADESRELARIVAERRFSWTSLLARLERTLPSDVGIARLQPRFEKDNEILLDLQLIGRSREAVVPTITALARDHAFVGVELKIEVAPEAAATQPYQFQLSCRYEPEATR